MPDWISIAEAVEMSGYNPNHIRILLRHGRIQAERRGTMWWIDRTSFEAYLDKAKKSPDKRKGPRKTRT